MKLTIIFHFVFQFINESARPILNEVGCQNILVDALLWHLLSDKSNTTPSFSTNPRGGVNLSSNVKPFSEIIANESFVLLSAEELSEYLRKDDLAIDSEEILFHVLTKWYKHDAINRQGAVKEMLPLIRFGDLSPEVCVQFLN